ncbi:hypothetical protein A2982_03810 [candidate division WWE3 bacterium RIFCSPLOWO2_01_FULL_39_13]|uniref:Glycosyltransferase 2-like domain-containing protein n=1 Tax=candidate division WWE3 bacterium RIFCSPLOWO2_01_FULL_39_13 TaxID=1802624 RepID=A0A1F4V3Q3_UNCKA|nr:MAG: hypothetical protein A2982_03810 [candidate division WWE3 bacterium RIFCSPLOWO2_01_FULL_39_13]
MKIVVVIPAYNEAKNIENTVNSLNSVFKKIKGHQLHILITDGNSPDGTADVVRRIMQKDTDVHLINEKKKAGLGAAYIGAMDYAFDSMKADAVVSFDADLSHDPEIIPDFVKNLENGVQYICGTRYRKGGGIPDEWGLHRKFLSYFGNLFVRVLYFKSGLSDFTSGYKCFTREVYKKIRDKVKIHSGYTFAISGNLEPLRAGYKIVEVPYKFKERVYGQSKMPSAYIIGAFKFVVSGRIEDFLKIRFARVFAAGGVGGVFQFLSYGLIFLPLIENANIINLPSVSILPVVDKVFYPRFLVSQLLSIEIGLTLSFLVNNFWSFGDKKLKGLPLARGYVKNHGIVAGAIVIQLITAQFLASLFGINLVLKYLYQTIGILLGLIWNFYFYKKIIWKIKK